MQNASPAAERLRFVSEENWRPSFQLLPSGNREPSPLTCCLPSCKYSSSPHVAVAKLQVAQSYFAIPVITIRSKPINMYLHWYNQEELRACKSFQNTDLASCSSRACRWSSPMEPVPREGGNGLLSSHSWKTKHCCSTSSPHFFLPLLKLQPLNHEPQE